MALGSNYQYISSFLYTFTNHEDPSLVWGRVSSVSLVLLNTLVLLFITFSPLSFRWSSLGYMSVGLDTEGAGEETDDLLRSNSPGPDLDIESRDMSTFVEEGSSSDGDLLM